MGAPVPLRTDIPPGRLRRLARRKADGRVACRLAGAAARPGSTTASSVMQVSDGEAMLRQVAAIAVQKNIIGSDAEELWEAIAAEPELRNAAAHVLATLGRTNVLILLDRLISRRDVLVG